jgi:phosphoglucomutase
LCLTIIILSDPIVVAPLRAWSGVLRRSILCGAEEIYRIYAESFRGEAHLRQIEEEAQAIIGQAFQP